MRIGSSDPFPLGNLAEIPVKLDGAQAGRCLSFFPFCLDSWFYFVDLFIFVFVVVVFCVDWDGFFPKKVFCAVDVELMLS